MDSAFQAFKGGIRSQETLQVYKYSLDEFMRFVSVKKYDDCVRLQPKTIQNLIKIWILDLSDRDIKGTTIRAKLNAIELFIAMNDIIINNKLLKKLVPANDYIPGGEVAYTTEEVQRMLSSTTKLRTKALVHFMASTGARPAAITDPVLKRKDLYINSILNYKP